MKLDEKIIRKLRKIVGPKNLLTEREELVCYSYDAAGIESLPEAAVFPSNASEISSIVKLANTFKFRVYPRGAGSGNVGGAVPVGGGLVIALNRLNRIIEIDVENQFAVVEPGVVTGEFQKAVENVGLFYPPDPASLGFCTIGGNVATGAGGPRAVKYGVTYNYVLGVEVVLPSGEILQTGRKTVKGVVGYDLTSLFIGSEGTLGIFTKIILRLLPKPAAVATILAVFDKMEDSMQVVHALLESQTLPSTIEFLDRSSIEAVEKHFTLGFGPETDAVLILETDGDPEIVEVMKRRIGQICKQHRAREIRVAECSEDRESIWKVRRSVSPALLRLKPGKINEDICVPRSKIPDIVTKLREIAKKYDIMVASFGHAGDGNVHVNFLVDRKNTEELVRAERAVRDLFRAVLELGGTISGEHGIGIAKSPFIEWEIGEVGLRVSMRIKRALDPNNIMNPGKILEKDYSFFRRKPRDIACRRG